MQVDWRAALGLAAAFVFLLAALYWTHVRIEKKLDALGGRRPDAADKAEKAEKGGDAPSPPRARAFDV